MMDEKPKIKTKKKPLTKQEKSEKAKLAKAAKLEVRIKKQDVKRRKSVAPGLLGDALFDPCVKCTICVQACPVASVTDKFPGPKQAGPDAQRYRRREDDAIDDWIEYCTGCRRCEVACPSDVPIARLNILAKYRKQAQQGLALSTKILTRTFLFAESGSLLAPLANRALNTGIVRRLNQIFAGIDARRPLPAFSFTTFGAWAKGRKSKAAKHKVAYFHGCFTNNNAPEVGQAVVRVLENLGCEVVVPEQYCCGAAMIGAGDIEAATWQANKNIQALTPLVEQGIPILVSSTSCCLALGSEYVETLGLEEARPLSEMTIDAMEYIANLVEEEGLPPIENPEPLNAWYHIACHQEALGIGTPATALLNKIPNVKVRLLDGGCCGLGGTYGFKHDKYDVSQAIGEHLAKRVDQVGAKKILTECEGCRMQIETLTGIDCEHPIQILAKALGV
jgi:glycerol-3-phosphate dehydrogenase subunit C